MICKYLVAMPLVVAAVLMLLAVSSPVEAAEKEAECTKAKGKCVEKKKGCDQSWSDLACPSGGWFSSKTECCAPKMACALDSHCKNIKCKRPTSKKVCNDSNRCVCRVVNNDKKGNECARARGECELRKDGCENPKVFTARLECPGNKLCCAPKFACSEDEHCRNVTCKNRTSKKVCNTNSKRCTCRAALSKDD